MGNCQGQKILFGGVDAFVHFHQNHVIRLDSYWSALDAAILIRRLSSSLGVCLNDCLAFDKFQT